MASGHATQRPHATPRWFFAALLCCALFTHEHRAADAGEQKKNVEADLRVVVFDFTAGPGVTDTDAAGRAFRDELKKFAQFSLLDIGTINRALASARPEAAGPGSVREKALAVGRTIGAHKVITGMVRKDGDTMKLTAEVLDTGEAAVDLDRRFEKGALTDEDIRSFARNVAEGMLGVIREKEPKKEPEKARPHSAGLSFGVLDPGEKISAYLNTTFLVRLNYTCEMSLFRNTGLEVSAGYARAGSTDAIAGEVDMTLVPFTALLVRRFHLSDRFYIPDPVIYGGGGITYLYLSGKSRGETVSRRGFDLTAAGGAGLAFPLPGPLSIQFQALLYYLYEDIVVTYRYYGIALQYLL